jgi:REP element-mobilizing transposase RayT
MQNNLPQRKNIRLRDYDYSSPGYYFITVCTNNKQHLLSRIVDAGLHIKSDNLTETVGGGFHAGPQIKLTPIGKKVAETIDYINCNYPNVEIDKYVIMPNHVHLIIILKQSLSGGRGNPPLHKIIGQFKSYTNKIFNELNRSTNEKLWQRNYYEHIIRNQQEYDQILEYIDTNPQKWYEDQYYV